MSCACKKAARVVYVWTPDGGGGSVEFRSEIAAKAKVSRKGGSYVEVEKTCG